jgi:CRISPR/Cas system CMR subunit Cmr6 (Cas7 group RAMP superfamily)
MILMTTPISPVDDEKQLISNKKFSIFNDELIDRYFNDQGKKAIRKYIDATPTPQVPVDELQELRLVLKHYSEYAGDYQGETDYDEDVAIHAIAGLIAQSNRALLEAVKAKVIGDDEPSRARPDKLKQSPPWQRNQLREKQRKAIGEVAKKYGL